MSSWQTTKPEPVDPFSGQVEATAKCGHDVSDTVMFLGCECSKEEYQIIARNLADYFSILEKWRQQENRSEKKENL